MSIGLLCILLLLFTGCQRRDEVIAGVDIPIPKSMTKNTDTPIEPVPGFEEGQVSYQGKVTPEEIFTFYQEVMAAKGWQPTARYADKDNRIAYIKQNKLALIRYNQVPDGTTILTVLVRTEEPVK
jgi:hypothetical protein